MTLQPRCTGIRHTLMARCRQLEMDLAHFDTWQMANLGYGNALTDDASVAFDQATQLTLRHNAEKRLQQVQQALIRLEKGDYGICEGCMQTIDAERLQALPDARLCLDCRRLQERSPLGKLPPRNKPEHRIYRQM